MKAFALVLIVSLAALATAAVTDFTYSETAAGVAADFLYIKPSGLAGTTFTLTPVCDNAPTDCTVTPTWTSTPDILGGAAPAGTVAAAGTATATAGPVLTIDTTQLGTVARFVLTFTAGATPVSRKLVMYVTESTIYTAYPSIADRWAATLVNSYPRNRQVAPVQGTPSSVDAPLTFIDTPTTPKVVPLYWGNSFEVRIGLTNAGTWNTDTTGVYCGSTGVWGTSTNVNDDDVPPVVTDNSGCDRYLEQGDVWTFPAPKQRITDYNTIANQVGQNDYFDGPLTFSVRNGTGSSLVFTGRSYVAADWLASCVPADLNVVAPATTPANYPCNLPRFNPDPQVWIITASKPQPTRFTGISPSSVTTPVVTPRYQATPKIFLGDVDKTNDFTVKLEWADLAAVAATTTSPAQTATTVNDVPTCAGTTFAGKDPAATTVIGVGRYVTCDQGLTTSVACTASATVTNCLTAAQALTAGATWGSALQTNVFQSVFVAQKPLALRPPGAAEATLNPTTGAVAAATYTATVGGRSGAFTVGFPQVSYPGGAPISVNYWNTVANDTVLSITPRFVYECAAGGVSACIAPVTGGALPEYKAGNLADFFGSATPPTLNISSSTPVATFTFSNLPFPTQDGATWRMYFDVRDAVTKATPAGYSWSAMPRLDITVNPIKATFVNFPPADNEPIYITQPQTNNGYVYELRIEKSASELGLNEIRIAFTLPTTDPVVFFVNGTAISSGGNGAFVFTGFQKVIHFQVIAAAEVTTPFFVTFTDPVTGFLTNPADVSLTVAKNPISVKLPNSESAGPYVREAFDIEFTWSPPATSAFTITIRSDGLEQASTDVAVNVGDTGVVARNLTAKPTQAASLSSDSFSIAVQFTTNSAVYSLPTVANLDIYRHSFVTTNVYNGASALTLYTSGQKSREFCISTNYPVFSSSFTTDSDSVILNFAAVDGETLNIPGVIVEPGNGSTGGANYLVLNKANNGRGCVTLRADRLFNWDSLGLPGSASTPNSWNFVINTYLGGSLANMFQNPTASGVTGGRAIWNFPSGVTVQRVNINFIKPVSSLTGAADTFALGETVTAFAYVDVLPPVGLTYNLKANPAVTISPSSATLNGAGLGFQWHAWNITFATPLTGNTYAGFAAATPLTVDFSLYVAGADATFYRSTDPSVSVAEVAKVYSASVVPRTVNIVLPGTTTVQVGSSLDNVQISLQHPVVQSLTVKLIARSTNGVASAGLSFSPDSVTFTPSSANSAVISVTGNLLGDYTFGYELSGPDAEWFQVNVDTFNDWNTVTVTQRTAATLATVSTIYAGVTYGPFAIGFGSPLLALNESVTITPFGSDFTFTPTSFTLTAGQLQAPFSFVFKPQARVSTAVVFWRVSGPSAWKYALPAGGRQEFTVLYLDAEIVLQGNSGVVPGVAHEGYVAIPFPATVSFTPSLIGAAVTFSPATFDFTPSTGNVIHFTYTVSGAQTFPLASANIDVSPAAKRASSGSVDPDTTGLTLSIPFAVTGSDAALFADPFVLRTVKVVRPQFLLEATYQDDGVISNAVEQNSGIFVVGKWSQKYSIHLAAAPASGPVTLTLTDSKGVVHFEVFTASGTTAPATSATLTFTSDNYVQYFRFRFVNLLSEDMTYNALQRLSVSVSQPFYDYSEIYAAFNGLTVVPALAFSPIPAIYTDGAAEGLFVALKDEDGVIGQSWPYENDAQFTLHIVPSVAEAVIVEPSTLEFSKSALPTPVQGFTIRHVNSHHFAGLRSYSLKFYVRFAGSNNAWKEITSIVPQDAQNVLLSRYQVIPKFPHVLSYGWQKASLNISFTPLAHISFIPRLPPVDGDTSVRGAHAAGRVDFDPAVIVAAPGQMVVDFKVKAQPGIDRDSLYYRVDWEVVGHDDDLVNLVESLQVGAKGLTNNGAPIHFATWHLASAGMTTVSMVLVAFVCVIALARNFF